MRSKMSEVNGALSYVASTPSVFTVPSNNARVTAYGWGVPMRTAPNTLPHLEESSPRAASNIA